MEAGRGRSNPGGARTRTGRGLCLEQQAVAEAHPPDPAHAVIVGLGAVGQRGRRGSVRDGAARTRGELPRAVNIS